MKPRFDTTVNRLLAIAGPFRSALNADEGETSSAIYCAKCGTIICEVLSFGSLELADWDAYFIAQALNYRNSCPEYSLLLNDAYRRKGLEEFWIDFPGSLTLEQNSNRANPLWIVGAHEAARMEVKVNERLGAPAVVAQSIVDAMNMFNEFLKEELA